MVLTETPRAMAAPPASSLYTELVAAAEWGHSKVDFRKLRYSYAFSGQYDPYGFRTRGLFNELTNALGAGDCGIVLRKADELLRDDYTSIEIHAARHKCLLRLGNRKDASREAAIEKGLAESILNSGDGKSAPTAYVVVTLAEERYVLSHLGITATRQRLLFREQTPFDLISGTSGPAQREASVYFNVAALLASTQRPVAPDAPYGSTIPRTP